MKHPEAGGNQKLVVVVDALVTTVPSVPVPPALNGAATSQKLGVI